jgi:RNA polymerase sigma-70 factor (ECF subfamily)
LLAAWREGDERAGNQLFERHFDSVFRFFENKIDTGVEDLVQDVFLACLRGRDRFREEASFRTYLFRVARNKLYDHFRARYRNPIDFTERSAVDLGTSPSRAAARKQEQQLLLRGLRAVPVDYQIALELYYWEGLRGPELAEILDLNPNTVRSRLHRARKALEEAIGKCAATPETIEATITNLEQWAESLRKRVQPDSSG